MKMNMFSKCSLLAFLCASVLVGQAGAVDLAEAAEVMSDVEARSASAKAALAEAAAESGDTVEAKERSDAIDAAVAMARDAFANMDLSIQNGDIDAAESYEDDLAAALALVVDALTGALPEQMVETADGEGNITQSGDDAPDDPPNIYEVPWKSQGIKAYYQSLFGKWYNARAFGHGKGFGDRDATPE